MAGDKKAVTLLADDKLDDLLDKLSGYVKPEQRILLLARYHHLKPEALNKAATRWPHLQLDFMTIHASKGQQADFVIVLGLQDGEDAFPAPARESIMEQALLPQPEDFPDAEERRLLYVALTRARHRVWLLFNKAQPSPFVEILQALDVHLEENIFSFDPGSKAAALEKVFPMLEDIRVERDYPSTVVVRVTEAQPAYAMQTAKGWLTLSAGLKILAADSAQPTGLPTLYGGEPVFSDPGEQLCFEEETPADSSTASESASDPASASAAVEEEAGDKRLEALSTLLTALDTAGMRGDVTRIEFADPEEMAFLYQDRISVRLGTLNELDYKLKLARHVLLNEDGKGCAATDTGTLDFTHISMSSTRKFTFAQGEPELPSGYVVPEPTTPEEAPAEETADSTAEGAADEAAPPADAAAQPADDAQAPTTETDPAPAAQDTAGTGAAN